MIFVKLLSGPFADEIREIPKSENPMDFFRMLVKLDWNWGTDYSQATQQEISSWFRAEIVARIIRALEQYLPVIFMDHKWQLQRHEDLIRVANDIEDAIVASGRIITINSDDDKGLVIGVRGYE